jgi:hypothetical protein
MTDPAKIAASLTEKQREALGRARNEVAGIARKLEILARPSPKGVFPRLGKNLHKVICHRMPSVPARAILKENTDAE